MIKNWKAYAVEFLMLFTAVTLGFFAENIREHQEEKAKEIQFLQNVHYDLERDYTDAQLVIDFNLEKQKLADSVVHEFKSGRYLKEPADMYYFLKGLSIRKMFEHSSSGFAQLKNAGGLRMIEDKSIIKQILLIENRLAMIDRLQDIMDENLLLYREKFSIVADAETVHEMNNKQISGTFTDPKLSLRRFPKPTNPNPFLVEGNKEMNEVVNLIVNVLNTTRYINNHLLSLKDEIKKLDSEIIDKYGSKFEE